MFDNITEDEFKSMMRFAEKYNAHLDHEIKSKDYYIEYGDIVIS